MEGIMDEPLYDVNESDAFFGNKDDQSQKHDRTAYSTTGHQVLPPQQEPWQSSNRPLDHIHNNNNNNNNESYDSFTGYSIVTSTAGTTTPLPPSMDRLSTSTGSAKSITASAIVNSDIPATAKKVLLQLENDDENDDNEDGSNTSVQENQPPNNLTDSYSDHHNHNTNNYDHTTTPVATFTITDATAEDDGMTTNTADMEQSRSISLLQKLRQSAFRRKMNHTTTNNPTMMIDHHTTRNSPSVSPITQFPTNPVMITTNHHDINLLSSPTSVRDRTTLSPPPTSILKHRTNSTFASVSSSRRSDTSASTSFLHNRDNQNNNHIDLSPQTLVVGRLEHGMLNLRSPLIQRRTHSDHDDDEDNDDDDHIIPSTDNYENDKNVIIIPHHQVTDSYYGNRRQSPDSLMISDSSLEGDFDSHSEMITATSIISSDLQHTSFDTTPNIAVGETSISNHVNTNTGSNSMEFIQQLRGAAFRRKMNLTRSRDSLMNKEKQHREHNAAIKLQRELMEQNQQELLSMQHQQREQEHRKMKKQLPDKNIPFKALPLPKSSRLDSHHHHGGFVGVPKVEKRPPTIPISPHLGLRQHRRRPVGLNDNEEGKENDDVRNSRVDEQSVRSKTKSSHVPTLNTFKALPIPKSSLPVGGAGQAGIPKVSKRMVTIPQSPLLGLRRPSQPRLQQQAVTSVSSRTLTKSKCNVRSEMMTNPIGLVKSSMQQRILMTSSIQPYVPHSTHRAMQRAEFEQRRLQNEQIRMAQERHKQEQLLQRLQGELERLRIEI